MERCTRPRPELPCRPTPAPKQPTAWAPNTLSIHSTQHLDDRILYSATPPRSDDDRGLCTSNFSRLFLAPLPRIPEQLAQYCHFLHWQLSGFRKNDAKHGVAPRARDCPSPRSKVYLPLRTHCDISFQVRSLLRQRPRFVCDSRKKQETSPHSLSGWSRSIRDQIRSRQPANSSIRAPSPTSQKRGLSVGLGWL